MKTEIIILIERREGSGYGFGRTSPGIIMRVKGMDEGTNYPRNLTGNNMQSPVYFEDYPKRCHGMCLDGIEIRGHVYEVEKDRPQMIGLEPAIYDAYSIDERELRGYTKALKAINKAISESGNPEDVGVVLTAMAKAVGATAVVHQREDTKASMYSDSKWWIDDIPQGARRARELEAICLSESREQVEQSA